MASGGTSWESARRLREDVPTVDLRGGSCTTGHPLGPVADPEGWGPGGSEAAPGGAFRGHAPLAGRVARWARSPGPAGREMGQAAPGGMDWSRWSRSGEPSVYPGAGPGMDCWRQRGWGAYQPRGSGGWSWGEAGLWGTGLAPSGGLGPGEAVPVAAVGRRLPAFRNHSEGERVLLPLRSGDSEGATHGAWGPGLSSGGLTGANRVRVFTRGTGAARDLERV